MSHTPYTGQPNPGARLPLPITGTRPGPNPICADCGDRAPDGVHRRLFRATQEPICGQCASDRGILFPHWVAARTAHLAPRFLLDDAVAALQWKGSHLHLARKLTEIGYVSIRSKGLRFWLRKGLA